MKYHAPFGSVDPDAPYVDRNTPGAVRGSVPPAAAIEWDMREIVDVITKGGLVPADVLQLADAIRRLANLSNFAVFTVGTTIWTAPAGVRWANYDLFGGAGGGAGCSATSAATGGAAGGRTTGGRAVIPGNDYTCIVGAGGLGGAAGVNNGENGGTTSFAGTVSATGGVGGRSIASGYPNPPTGGMGFNGRLNLRGGSGGGAKLMTTGRYQAGGGGGVSGGGAPTPDAGDSAFAGSYPGGGGSGGGSDAGNANAGGDGADGLILLQWS